MFTHIVDVFVYLVGNDDDPFVPEEDIFQGSQFVFAIYGASRVRGRAEDEGSRLGCDGSLELLGCDFEILLYGSLDDNRCSFGKQHHLRIAYPVRCWYDHFVSCIHQCHDGVADRLFRTVRTQDLCGRIVQSVFRLQFLDDGVAQAGVSGNGAVPAPVILDSLDGSCLDVVRSIEVWFPHTKIDDIDALGFHLRTFLRHC